MRVSVAHSDFGMGSLDQSFCCSKNSGLIPMEMKQWSLETVVPSDLTHPRAGPWALRLGFLRAFLLDHWWTGHGWFQKDIQTQEVLACPWTSMGLRNKSHLWAFNFKQLMFKQGAAGKEQALRRYWPSGKGQQRTPSSLLPPPMTIQKGSSFFSLDHFKSHLSSWSSSKRM